MLFHIIVLLNKILFAIITTAIAYSIFNCSLITDLLFSDSMNIRREPPGYDHKGNMITIHHLNEQMINEYIAE